MCRKLIYLFSVVLLLGLVGSVRADPNLVAHWTFYDGRTDDISGYGTPAHGTLMGDAKVVKDPDRGLVLRMYNDNWQTPWMFDTEPNYMDCGYDEKFDITGSITLAAWVKPFSTPLFAAAPFLTLIAKGSNGYYLAGGFNDGVRFVGTEIDPDDFLDNPGSIYNDGLWHHVVGVFDQDGSMLYVYVDGSGDVTTKATDDNQSIRETNYPVRVGMSNANYRDVFALDGLIDDVRIYNRALSAMDVDAIMSEPIMVYYGAWNPDPKDDEASVLPSTATISWTRPDPRVPLDPNVRVDVFFGTDPCMVINTTQLETYADVDSTTVSLAADETYYWRVDCNDPNSGGSPVMTTGYIWSFDTINRAPAVGAGRNRVGLMSSAATIELDATVTDDGLPEGGPAITYEWTAVSGPNIPGTVTFAPSANVEDPCAIFTESGTYELNLVAGDSVKEANDTAKVFIYPVGYDPLGLVLHYEFEDGVGSDIAGDISGYSDPPKDGEIHVGVGNGVIDDNIERLGQVLRLKGGNVMIEDHDDLDVTTGITVAMWFKPDDPWNSSPRLMEKRKSGPDPYRIVRSGGNLSWNIGVEPSSDEETVTIPLPSAGTWHHLACTYDSASGDQKIYLDGEEVASEVVGGPLRTSSEVVCIGAQDPDSEAHEHYHGLIDDFRIYDRALNENEIADLLTDMIIAWGARPIDGATGVARTVILSWSAGDEAVSHDVYFSTNFDDVNEATDPNVSPCVSMEHPDVNFTPAQALDLDTTYYWRIDEVDAGGNRARGHVWRFTTVDYFVVDDFESYADQSALEGTWTEAEWAYEYLSVSPDPVHGGTQAIKVEYQNQYDPFISEVFRTPADPNWTRAGVKALDLWFRGDATNVAGQPIYVRLHDSDSDATVTYADPNLQNESWRVWHIALKDFTGVDMNNVTKLVIGIGDGADSGQQGGDTDIAYFDDIRLYLARCFTSLVPTDFTGDCITNNRDLDIMVGDWLDGDYTVSAAEPDPNRMVVQYKFEEGSGTTAIDSSGNSNDGTISGGAVWGGIGTGYDGNDCLIFDGINDEVVKTGAVNLPTGADDAWSINMYLYMDANQDPNTLIGGFGAAIGNIAEERYLVSPSEIEDGITFWIGNVAGVGYVPVVTDEPFDVNTGTWQMITITREGGITKVWKNGTEIGSSAQTLVAAVADVRLATDVLWGGRFKGKIDEFTIWEGALTEAEILYLANVPSVYYKLESDAELYTAEPTNSKKINFRDYAILGNEWLKEELFGN